MQREREHAGHDRRPERRERAASRSGPSACTTCPHPPQEAARRVLRADQRVGGRVGPLRGDAGERRASARSSVSAGHGAVGREHDPARRASRARARRRAARAAGRGGSRGWKPVAQITCSAPFSSGCDAEALARRARAARPSSRPGGYEGASSAAEHRARARRGSVAWKRGEPAAREERPRHVERPPQRLAPAHRGDPRAGGERVQPLGRRRHAGADDGDVVRVLVRLVGVDGARVAGELRRDVQARVAGGDAARGGTCRSPSSSKPPSTARIRSMRRGTTASSQPVRAAQLLDVLEELVDGRVVAVADALHERPRAAPPPAPRAPRAPGTTSAGSARRSPSASAAAGSPPRAAATPPPGRRPRRRRRSRPPADAAVAQRRVRDEAGEPAADDRARRDGPRSLHRAGEQPLDEVALEREEDGERARAAR